MTESFVLPESVTMAATGSFEQAPGKAIAVRIENLISHHTGADPVEMGETTENSCLLQIAKGRVVSIEAANLPHLLIQSLFDKKVSVRPETANGKVLIVVHSNNKRRINPEAAERIRIALVPSSEKKPILVCK